ncbi:MAG: acyl-CoA dehydrogenase family protein [Acidimicrobiales bacterium]
MRFSFEPHQREFQAGVRHLLGAEYPPECLRRDWADDPSAWKQTWASLGRMGVTGMTVPEEFGGLGLDEISLVLVLEEAGYAGLAGPLAETVGVAAPLLNDLMARAGRESSSRVAAWLARVAMGEAVITVDPGSDVHPYAVVDGAHGAVVIRDQRIYLIDLDQPGPLGFSPQPSVDGSRRLCRLEGEPAETDLVASGAALPISDAMNRAVLATSAQLIGVAARLVEMAAAYASTRRQFGQPIGSFQAVKHLMADALCRLEFARPVVYRAAHSMARSSSSRSRDVSMAKVLAGEAAKVAARTALQVHGATGYTWESDVHLWMKRAWALNADWGDATYHTDRVARAVLGPGGEVARAVLGPGGTDPVRPGI